MASKSSLMDPKIIGMLVIGILVGAGVGHGASHFIYTPKINGLRIELIDLRFKFETLSEQFETLSADHEALKSERDSLQTQYSTLQSDLYRISNDYERASKYLKDLSSDVQGFYDLLGSYSSLTESFQRVLNAEELEKIALTVAAVTQESEDNWDAYERIYKHVANKIDYAPDDVEFPYIAEYRRETVGGDEVLSGFSVETTSNYVQKPWFTLEHKQGHVEDQVVAAYAMIKYYERNIYETEYPSYIAEIEFSEAPPYLVVFLPVKGGRTKTPRLCILDPIEQYYTSKLGQMIQREVSVELETYARVRAKAAGEITHITLYDIDVSDGSHTVAASGTLLEIAEFLATE